MPDQPNADEARWLAAAQPLLAYARELALPLDVVVLRGELPGRSPLALGYGDGRCKLVLAVRDNAPLRAMLADVPPELFAPVAESMVAHELGHCWRHVSGSLHTLPEPTAPHPGGDAELAQLRREMSPTRREEAFADLVSLAWTQRQWPQQYAGVYAWLVRMRRHPHDTGKPHDTRSWLRLAADPKVFNANVTPHVFEQAGALWARALQP